MSIFGRFRRRFDPWSVASIAVLSFCLWMSWQPAAQTSASTRPQPSVTDHTEPVIRAIVDYKVGDAVLADEQRGEHDTSLGTHVDRATWRHLVLKARKVDGSTADVEFLRPAHWLTERHAKVGGTIEVSVPECGIEGQATVLAIHDCPRLQPTPPGYRTVTGTFRHASADILDITVKGLAEPSLQRTPPPTRRIQPRHQRVRKATRPDRPAPRQLAQIPPATSLGNRRHPPEGTSTLSPTENKQAKATVNCTMRFTGRSRLSSAH
jgi:hypothetical protein